MNAPNASVTTVPAYERTVGEVEIAPKIAPGSSSASNCLWYARKVRTAPRRAPSSWAAVPTSSETRP